MATGRHVCVCVSKGCFGLETAGWYSSGLIASCLVSVQVWIRASK